MGELHLDIKVDILKRTHGCEVIVGKPQVAYRETITKRIEDSYTHKKQSGGSGQYGKIDYIIEPLVPRKILRGSNSNPKWLVVTFLRNSGLLLKKDSSYPRIKVSSLDSPA